MYIEASGKSANKKARLISPIYRGPSQTMCMEFWYNMNGANINTLNVYVLRSGVRGNPVWTKKGERVLY